MRTYCSGRTPFGAIRPLLKNNKDGEARKNYWLTAAQPMAQWAGSLMIKRKILGGLWQAFTFSCFLFFVFLFWNCTEKKKQGEQSKLDTSLKETIYCIDIAPVNKTTTQHIWAERLRPHICLLMASQVTRWSVGKFAPWHSMSFTFLAVVSLLAISVLRCISWGTLCSKNGVYSYMKFNIQYIKYRETNVLSWINVTLRSSLLLFPLVIFSRLIALLCVNVCVSKNSRVRSAVWKARSVDTNEWTWCCHSSS